MNLSTNISFINKIHALRFRLKRQNHIFFTKSKYNGFFSHIAPEAVEIETGVSSMLILEENMELLKFYIES